MMETESQTSQKVLNLNQAVAFRQNFLPSQKVVFTNGCFDILHVGHVKYLQEARALGDALIVGLNSDASVKRLKGPSRPIQSQNDRAEILASLECVSAVIIFDEGTPLNLIQNILPNVLVKGGDWAVESIVGYDVVLAKGGEVKSLRFVEGRSSTSVIEKITSGPTPPQASLLETLSFEADSNASQNKKERDEDAQCNEGSNQNKIAKINIRWADEEDLDCLCEFQMQMAMETENLKLNETHLRQGVQALLLDKHKGRYLVAESVLGAEPASKNGELSGDESVTSGVAKPTVLASLLLIPEWSDWRNSTVLWIHSVFVRPELRGQGIYKTMYMQIKTQLAKQKLSVCGLRLYVDQNNPAAQSVYKKLGMKSDHYLLFEEML